MRYSSITGASPSEHLSVPGILLSAVWVTLIHLPDRGSWSMSPSRISESGTCSMACSELIALPNRPDRSTTPTLREFVSAITLRILPPTPLVNHRFSGGYRTEAPQPLG